jgi:hypothetical protein
MQPVGLSLNDSGNLVVVDTQKNAVFTISPTGVVLKLIDIGFLSTFHDVCTSGSSVFVVDTDNFQVIVIDDLDNVSTFADLGAGSGAFPLGMALSLDENDNIILFIPGRFGELYKYENLDGSLGLLPFAVSKFDVETDSGNAIYGMGAPLGLLKIIEEAGVYTGHILVDDGSGSIDGLTSVATVSEITAFTTDEDNVLYFADFETNTIRKVEK